MKNTEEERKTGRKKLHWTRKKERKKERKIRNAITIKERKQ